LSKKILTRDEEADEIIRRLSMPPTRRFNASWTMEAMNDLKTQHGLDLEEELAKALAIEIDREILQELKALYGKGTI